jgi:hypothetical protein
VLNDRFRQDDLVKVALLLDAPQSYDSFRVNARVPAIGDIGAVVEVLKSKDGETRFLVECLEPDGSTAWLSSFRAAELIR